MLRPGCRVLAGHPDICDFCGSNHGLSFEPTPEETRRPFSFRALRLSRHASDESGRLETFLDVVSEHLRRRLDSYLDLQPDAGLRSGEYRSRRSRSARSCWSRIIDRSSTCMSCRRRSFATPHGASNFSFRCAAGSFTTQSAGHVRESGDGLVVDVSAVLCVRRKSDA